MKILRTILLSLLVVISSSSLASARLPDFMLKKMGTMTGQIFVDGQPMKFAIISFFLTKNGPPPLEDGMRRVPELLSRTDGEGHFRTRLLAGEYYVGILMRSPDAGPGPPREGEKYFFAGTDSGELAVISVTAQKEGDVGSLNGQAPENFSLAQEFFTVKGTVKNEAGIAYPGVVVLGKSRLNIPRPEFISKRTGADGAYELRLPVNKQYYLVARETIANARPRPGSHIGTYGIESKTGLATPSIFSAGSPPPGVMESDKGGKALQVSGGPGEVISGIDIFMYKVPDPEEIKASVQGTKNSPRFEKGAALNNILFANNSRKLVESSYIELDQWVLFLKGRPDLKVELHGHTDNHGDASYNLHLSRDRAHAVADYLHSKGIARSRMSVTGHGPDRPVATNATEEGRGQNRRVEIKFIDQDEEPGQ